MWQRLLTGVAALAAAAVTAPTGAAAKTICFVTFSLQVQYFQSSVAGGKKAAQELGHELVVMDPQADAGRQVTMLEDCVSRQVDAIVVDPIETSSLLGPIEEAGKRGIPIVSLDTKVDSPYVLALIGVPQHEASFVFGQYVAGFIAGKLDGKAKVGVMLASTEVQLARRDGFLEALKAVPGAEVVATGDGRNILERATAEAEDMLTAHPDLDVIYATGDPQLQGGLAAAASQGKKIAFFGWDDIPQPFIEPLKDGRIVGLLKQKPEVGGEMAVRLLGDKLAGKEIPSRYSYSPDVVTPFNLDKHL
jgi:ABC-type sugar transport system substrate-binding protein